MCAYIYIYITLNWCNRKMIGRLGYRTTRRLTVISYRFLLSSCAYTSVATAPRWATDEYTRLACQMWLRHTFISDYFKHHGDGTSYVRCEYLTLPLYVPWNTLRRNIAKTATCFAYFTARSLLKMLLKIKCHLVIFTAVLLQLGMYSGCIYYLLVPKYLGLLNA
jgi:hypothetical protein